MAIFNGRHLENDGKSSVLTNIPKVWDQDSSTSTKVKCGRMWNIHHTVIRRKKNIIWHILLGLSAPPQNTGSGAGCWEGGAAVSYSHTLLCGNRKWTSGLMVGWTALPCCCKAGAPCHSIHWVHTRPHHCTAYLHTILRGPPWERCYVLVVSLSRQA